MRAALSRFFLYGLYFVPTFIAVRLLLPELFGLDATIAAIVGLVVAIFTAGALERHREAMS